MLLCFSVIKIVLVKYEKDDHFYVWLLLVKFAWTFSVLCGSGFSQVSKVVLCFYDIFCHSFPENSVNCG